MAIFVRNCWFLKNSSLCVWQNVLSTMAICNKSPFCCDSCPFLTLVHLSFYYTLPAHIQCVCYRVTSCLRFIVTLTGFWRDVIDVKSSLTSEPPHPVSFHGHVVIWIQDSWILVCHSTLIPSIINHYIKSIHLSSLPITHAYGRIWFRNAIYMSR